MRRLRFTPLSALALTGFVALAAALAACGSPVAAPGVPALGNQPSSPVGAGERPALVHAAAQCIRQHGIPGYQEPVVTPDGQVYSDIRSIQNASRSVEAAVEHACGTLVARAGFDPTTEPPAPPALVQAGVDSSECMRANGLPNMRDPTAQSPWTAGHGFGITANEVPAGGKLSPQFQQAVSACRTQNDAEIRASTLSSLSNG